jgi:hypothetical protein
VIGENCPLNIEALVLLPCYHFFLYQLHSPDDDDNDVSEDILTGRL